jgi:hypothetical protein
VPVPLPMQNNRTRSRTVGAMMSGVERLAIRAPLALGALVGPPS